MPCSSNTTMERRNRSPPNSCWLICGLEEEEDALSAQRSALSRDRKTRGNGISNVDVAVDGT
jgi:hypothetical protein